MKSDFPKDNPFGMWLSELDFDPPEDFRQNIVPRSLPTIDDHHLVPPQWLDEKGGTVKKINRRKGSDAQIVKVQYRLRTIDNSCVFACESPVGEPIICLDVAPYVFHIVSSSRNGAVHIIRNFLESFRCVDVDFLLDSLAFEVGDSGSYELPELFFRNVVFKSRNQSDQTTTSYVEPRSVGGFFQLKYRPKVFINFGNDQINEGNIPLTVSYESSLESWTDHILKEVLSARSKIQAKVVEHQRALLNLRRELGSILLVSRSTSSVVRQKLTLALTQIKTDPRVESCILANENIFLTTKDVYGGIQDTTDRYFLGKFQFKISLTEGIRFRNIRLPCPPSDRIHPHGFTDGVCLGSYENVFLSCFSSFDYYTLMLSLLEWSGDIASDDSRAVGSLGRQFPKIAPPDKDLHRSPWVAFVSSAEVGEYAEEDPNSESENW